MRHDMYKIICERPRRGVGYWRTLRNEYRKAKHFKLTLDLDCLDEFSGATKLPMRAKSLGWDGKEFNDYLNPLYRFIDKQVGRPWDDVFSEICENITLDSTTRRHVRQHVDTHVEVNVTFNEYGDPCNKRAYRYYHTNLPPLSEGELYKDPNDGILKRAGYAKIYQLRDEERRSKRTENSAKVKVFGDITFKYETTGERKKQVTSWFKYHYIVVKRTRSVIDGFDENGHRKYRLEDYLDRVQVRHTASKAEIRTYGLND